MRALLLVAALLSSTLAAARDAGPADGGPRDAGTDAGAPAVVVGDPLTRARAMERLELIERVDDRTARLAAASDEAQEALARFRAAVDEQDAQLAEALAAARKWDKELLTLEVGSAAAAARYAEVAAAQKDAASSIHQALGERAAVFAPEARTVTRIARADRDAMPDDDDPEIRAALAALDAQLREVEALLQAGQTAQRETWYRVAHTWNDLALRFNELRQAHLGRLSRANAREAARLASKRAEDFQVEIDMLTGLVRFHNHDRVAQVRSLDIGRERGIAIGTRVLEVFLLVVFAIWVWRRAAALKGPVHRALQRRFRSPRGARLFASFWSLLEAAVPSAFVMGVATLSHLLLGEVGPQPEVRFLGHLVVWIAFARLLSQVTHRLILQVLRRHTPVGVREALKILRTVRWLMRYTLVHAFIVVEFVDPLGIWLLGRVVQIVAFIGYVPLVLFLLSRWQDEIVSTVGRRWPGSTLATSLSAAGRVRRFVLSLPALVLLTGAALVTLGRDFLNGFESTRRALAYLLRLQFEREQRGATEAHPELPPEVAAQLEPQRVCPPRYLVDRFEYRRALKDRLERFPELRAGRGNALLVCGEQGMGKSTWLSEMRAVVPDGMRAIHFAPTARVTSAGGLLRAIGALCDHELPPGIPSTEAVAEGFAGHRSVVFLDGLEWLFLRTIGGHEAIDALAELITATRETVYWVATVTTPAYRYLQQVGDLESVFLDRHDLLPWSEKELHHLILRRVHLSELKVSFADSVVRAFEGVSEVNQVIESQEGFIRLLWDFSKGNPSVAQHFWYRSLVRESDGSLTVRPISPPNADQIAEGMSELGAFVLATIFLHHGLGPLEIARALNVPRARVEAEIATGRSRGYLVPNETHPGTFEISVHWWEAALRFLARRKLVP